MNKEIHISSLIIQCMAESFDSVQAVLQLFPQVEIHAEEKIGKFIVTLETEGSKKMMSVIEDINKIPGVLNAAMVYHEISSEDELEEKQDLESLPTMAQVNKESITLNK